MTATFTFDIFSSLDGYGAHPRCVSESDHPSTD
jgi:hypothetical protein